MPFPPPGDLPDPVIEPLSLVSPALQVDSLPTDLPGKTLDPSVLSQVTVFHDLWLSSIPLCMCTTCVPIHLLADT